MDTIPQKHQKVKKARYQENKAKVLELADLCLQKYNRARAQYVITGDPGAFKLALALEADREALLRQVGGGP